MNQYGEKLSSQEITQKVMGVDVSYILPKKDNRIFMYMHGLFGDKNSSKGQEILLNTLEKERGTVRFSFRGNGGSHNEDFGFEDMTMNTMAEDVKNIVAYLKEKGEYKFTMVCSSLGASALMYALKKYPEIVGYVKNIVMLAPSIEFAKNKQNIWKRENDMITEKKWREQGYLKKYHFANQSEEKLNYTLFEESLKMDLLPLLKSINKPITMIAGRKDDIVSFSRLDQIAKENENITLIGVHDGHRLKTYSSLIINNTVV